MVCSKCGKEADDSWTTCPYCGEGLKGNNTDKSNSLRGGIGEYTDSGNLNVDTYKNQSTNDYQNSPIKKKGKKTHIMVAIIIILILALWGLYKLGSSEEEHDSSEIDQSSTEINQNLSETNQNSDSNEVVDKSDIISDKHHTGESIKLYSADGSDEICITVTGWKSTIWSDDSRILCISYVIENTGNTEVLINENIFAVYADDYKVDLVNGENTIYSQNLSPGRKLSGTLYAKVSMEVHKIVEVDCSGYIYLLWDDSFIEKTVGTFSWAEEDRGANITIESFDNEYGGYLRMDGECWNGDEIGRFSTGDALGYEANYNSNTGIGSVVFSGIWDDIEIVVTPIDDGGIYIEQKGLIHKVGTFENATKASFTGTYYPGTSESPQTPTDKSSTDGEYTELPTVTGDTYYWQEGESEDACGAEVTIGYDDNGELRIVGESWNSINDIVINAVVTIINDDGSMEFDCYDTNNEGVLYVYPTENGGIRIVQDGMIDGVMNELTFDGVYQLLVE